MIKLRTLDIDNANHNNNLVNFFIHKLSPLSKFITVLAVVEYICYTKQGVFINACKVVYVITISSIAELEEG